MARRNRTQKVRKNRKVMKGGTESVGFKAFEDAQEAEKEAWINQEATVEAEEMAAARGDWRRFKELKQMKGDIATLAEFDEKADNFEKKKVKDIQSILRKKAAEEEEAERWRALENRERFALLEAMGKAAEEKAAEEDEGHLPILAKAALVGQPTKAAAPAKKKKPSKGKKKKPSKGKGRGRGKSKGKSKGRGKGTPKAKANKGSKKKATHRAKQVLHTLQRKGRGKQSKRGAPKRRAGARVQANPYSEQFEFQI